METKKFVLLDIDYITRNRNPVVRLFGRLDDGRSIIALDKNFKPYIYVQTFDITECMDELNSLGLTQIEKVHKIDNGIEKEFLKVTLDHPRDMPKLKKRIMNLKSVEDIREHDIPFHHRYLINKGLPPMSEVVVKGRCINPLSLSNKPSIFEIEGDPTLVKSDPPKLKLLSFIIEICSPKLQPSANQDPINIISFSSNQGFQKVFSTKPSSLDFVETVQNEEELIKKYIDTVKSESPDLIVGYHSDNFDFPYLKERASQLGVPLNLGMDGSKVKFMKIGHRNTALIKGMVHVDLYRVVRRHLQLNSHTLQNVYLKLYKEDKVDIPADEVYNSWNDGEKLDKLIRFSLENAIAITKIGKIILPMVIELSRLVGLSLFEVTRRGTGTQVKWHLIRKAHELGHILPNEPGKFERNVVGGWVAEPVKGMHENIVYFDFRSLYPSIIVAKNISPDTLTEHGDKETCHIAPEFGYKYKKEPVGFIPLVISEILNDRTQLKSKMKESTDPKQKQILNFRQEALKTVISTFYGLFNHPQYRWYCIEASEAITAWGREYLKNTMQKAEKYGFKVVYADTDGFYAIIQ